MNETRLDRFSRQQFTKAALPRLCLPMRLCFQKDVRFGSLADIAARSGMSALPRRTDILSVCINFC